MRKKAWKEPGPIVASHDPWLVRRGFVANPVLVKDLRMFKRHLLGLPKVVRAVSASLILAPLVLSALTIAIMGSFLGLVFEPWHIGLAFACAGTLFSASLLYALRPFGFPFLGVDENNADFEAIRLAGLGPREIVAAKAPFCIPVLIVFSSIMCGIITAFLHPAIAEKVFLLRSWWGVASPEKYIEHGMLSAGMLFLYFSAAILVGGWLAYWTFMAILNIGSSNYIRWILIIVWLVICYFIWTIDSYSYFSKKDCSGYYLNSITPYAAVYMAACGLYARPLKGNLMPYFASRRIPNEPSFYIWGEHLPQREARKVFLRDFSVLVLIQLLLAYLLRIGVTWNIKRRLENWPVKTGINWNKSEYGR